MRPDACADGSPGDGPHCSYRVKAVAATLAAAPREQQAAVGPGIVQDQHFPGALLLIVLCRHVNREH